MYGWAADQLDPSWDVWFPDSLAQLWPVLDGLGDRPAGAALWAAFSRRWPGWTRSTPAYGTVAVEHDPNAAIAYAAARIGDRAAVDEYLLSTQERWVRRGRPPPWTVDDAGFRALAAHTMAERIVRSRAYGFTQPEPWARPRIRWPGPAVEGCLA